MNLERGRKLSWTNELYQVYENNCGKDDEKVVLLPLFHSTAKAQIEVTLTEMGEFVTSSRIEDKKDSETIIPVTEGSGSRSSGIYPHPFADKLIYIAGDYNQYVADMNAKEQAKAQQCYQAYIQQLEKWKDSEDVHPGVNAVFEYLKRGNLIQDLVESHSLLLDETTGKLKEKEKILEIAQKEVFVRFRIQYLELLKESKTWKDHSLYESYYSYYEKTLGNQQLCYATGKIAPCTYKHPSKIRHAGDKAKLISSNDENGFAYRGRFHSKEQAISVSYEFSQKIHNALKWLIAKQGVAIGTMELLVWASNLQSLPNVLGKLDGEDVETEDVWGDNWDLEEVKSEKQLQSDSIPSFKRKLKKAIWGSNGGKAICEEMDPNLKVMILILDSATTGRLSINLYEELPLTNFCDNLEKWATDTAWIRFNGKERKNEMGTFSLYEIVDYAYGTEQEDFDKCTLKLRNLKLRSKLILRLIQCVTDGRDIPAEIVMNLFHKACNPMAYKKRYNWRKVLETACGMIRKMIIEEKGECKVALDKTCKERDYLYGRLLAIAEVAERFTYDEEDETRITNASRYFEAFSNKPYQTWDVIQKRLTPYLQKMKMKNRIYYEKLFVEVNTLFDPIDYQDNSKLKPLFLLAYYCQLSELYKGKDKSKKDVEEEKNEYIEK